jgi:hypothetical protein
MNHPGATSTWSGRTRRSLSRFALTQSRSPPPCIHVSEYQAADTLTYLVHRHPTAHAEQSLFSLTMRAKFQMANKKPNVQSVTVDVLFCAHVVLSWLTWIYGHRALTSSVNARSRDSECTAVPWPSPDGAFILAFIITAPSPSGGRGHELITKYKFMGCMELSL